MGRRFPELDALLAGLGMTCERLDLTAPDYREKLRRRLSGQPTPEVVLGVGGDGTHFSVINDLMRLRTEGVDLPPYALCPFGTGNDIAKSIGLSPGRRHYRRVLETAAGGIARAVDLGRFENCYFMDMLSVGLDAEVLADRDRRVRQVLARGGRPHGYWLYALAVCRTFLRARRWNCRVWVDDRELFHGRAINVLVNNCPIHAGEFELTPGARLDDGRLDVVVIAGLWGYAWRYLRGFRFLPRVLRCRPGRFQAAGRRIVVESSIPVPVQVDGEGRENRQRVEAEVAPGAIVLRLPPD